MKHLLSLVVVASVVSAAPAFSEDASPELASEIMDLARAEWTALAAKDVAAAGKNTSDEYSEFNPQMPTRVEGKSLAMRLAEAQGKASGKQLADEMLNPKVQVYGDTAILSYNYFGLNQNKDGEISAIRAKSTRVYVKQGGKWMLVHANFGADPTEN